MNKRSIIAGLLATIGFLLIVGAVGSSEFGEIGVGEMFVRVGAGVALIAVAVPVGGAVKLKKMVGRTERVDNDTGQPF